MQGGILNEPVRENAEKLMTSFGEQLGLKFKHLIFIAIDEEGVFRSGNYAKELTLNADAVRLIAKHLDSWADSFEE